MDDQNGSRRRRHEELAVLIAAAVAIAAASITAQTPRQADATLFENEYLRAHLVTLNLVGHYRTAPDVPQAVYCLGTFVVSRDNGSRRRCAKDQLLFVDRGDQIELKADVEPRPDLLVVELKQEPAGQFFLAADDAATVAADVYKPLFENRFMRAFRFSLAPGLRTKMHWHPGNGFLVPLTAATLRVTPSDGEPRAMELRARVPRWTAAAGRHMLENSGTTEAFGVLFELK